MSEVTSENGTGLEDHFVLCESSRLVAKDMLDLSQILGYVERLAFRSFARLLVPHQRVAVDQVHLGQLHHLYGDVERYGNDDLKDYHKRPERQEALRQRVDVIRGKNCQERGLRGDERGVPYSATDSSCLAKDEEENPAPEEILVDAAFHFGSLEPRPETVEHRLRVLTRIEDQTNDAAGVLENCEQRWQALQALGVSPPARRPRHGSR